MLRYFKIYVFCIIVGWSCRLFWDLNHVYHWIKSGDAFFGIGIAVMFLGCAIYIDSTIKRKTFSKRHEYLLAKIFTQLFLFTTISNLCDEALFDPYEVSSHEWGTAFIIFLSLYIKAVWRTIKHIFQ